MKDILLGWILILTFTPDGHAQWGQYLGDQIGDEPSAPYLSSPNTDSAFVPEAASDLDSQFKEDFTEDELEEAASTVKIQDRLKDNRVTLEDETKSTDFFLPGQLPETEELATYTNMEVIQRGEKVSDTEFGIFIIKDDFDYKSSTNSFKRVYRSDGNVAVDKSESDPSYMMKLNWAKFFYRGPVDISYGMGLGIGYNGGKGVFPNNEVSTETTFRLWTAPLEFLVGLETHANSWVKFAAKGGPSVLGMYQYRNDLDDRDDRKHLRQFSPGFFAEGSVGINIFKVFTSYGREMLNEYDITKNYLTAYARVHNYGSFKEEGLEISGVSFGLGFVFEYF